jgi:hypothetical protein
MFCKTCGKQLDDTLKFCPSCGEQIDQVTPLESTRIQTSNSNTTRGAENTHDYAGDVKEAFNCFISYIISVLKTPTMALESVNEHLTGKMTLAYAAILAVIYSLIQSIFFKVFQGKLVSMLSDFTSQMSFGFGGLIENQLNIQEPKWFKLFISNFLFIIIFICILSLLSLVLYAMIMKKAAKFMDFVKIYLSSLVLLVVVTFVTVIATAISLKLMFGIMVIGSLLYITSIIVNFVNFLENEAKVIYTLPVIVFLSLFLTSYIFTKII